MIKDVFGIKINTKQELNSGLIKEEIGHIPNTEKELLTSTFITPESLRAGSAIAASILSQEEVDAINIPI